MLRFAGVAVAAALLSGGAVACTAPGAVTAYCNGHKATIVVSSKSPSVVSGTARNDVIAVTGGLHVVHGGAGNDLMCSDSLGSTLFGDAGNDSLIGQSGNDRLTGGTGNDVLQGQNGDDTLDGQGGNDNLNGGAGVNGCDLDAADTTTHDCRFDMTPPRVTDFQVLTPTVDITAGHPTLQLQAHVTDNLSGTYEVTVQFCDARGRQDPIPGVSLYLTSGTPADGIWTTSRDLSAFSPAGADTVCFVNMEDNATNLEFATFRGPADYRKLPNSTFAFDVINDQTDTTAPVISDVVVSASPDVTNGDATVTTDFTVMETGSGIGLMQLGLREDYTGSFADAQGQGAEPQLLTPASTGASGSGRYRAVVQLPKGSAAGKWHVTIYIQDLVSNEATVDTPLTVVDRHPITTVPQVVSVTRTAGNSPYTQTFAIHMVSAVAVNSMRVHATGPNSQFANAEFALTSGTALDGIWTATMQLPDNAAAGRWTPEEWGSDSFGRYFTPAAASDWTVG